MNIKQLNGLKMYFFIFSFKIIVQETIRTSNITIRSTNSKLILNKNKNINFYRNLQEIYKNPVKFNNHPDPGALQISKENGGGFIVVSTSNYEKSSKTGPAIPLLWSKDMVTWELVIFSFFKNS